VESGIAAGAEAGRHGLEAEVRDHGWGGPTRSSAGGQDADSGARNLNLGSNGQSRSGLRIAGGLTGWLLKRMRGEGRPRPQLAVLERITLAPRQSLALIEAGGQRLLVATSADGTPAFYPVGVCPEQAARRSRSTERVSRGRVSW
jgi:hypothetical protein